MKMDKTIDHCLVKGLFLVFFESFVFFWQQKK